MKTMSRDPILEELRLAREQLLEEAGGTLDALVAKLKQDERLSSRKFIDLKRPPQADLCQSGATCSDSTELTHEDRGA
jgi:hypothetical protein